MAWWEILLIVAYILFIFGYIFVFFFIYLKKYKRKLCLKNFGIILKKLHKQNLTIENAIQQLYINYNQLCVETTCEFKLIELLNIVIYRLDSNRLTILNNTEDNKDNTNSTFRDFVLEVYNTIDQEQPFSTLPDKEASILNNLKEAIQSYNIEIGNNLLEQLATEIKAKEKNYHEEKNKTTIATIVSIVGVIFTIIFGFLSMI